MHLQPGIPAPALELEDWKGERHTLACYRGRRVWLAFFRYASCPLCNLRVHRMIQRWDVWAESDFQLLAVFQSPPSSIAEYVGEQRPPFPLLGDPDEVYYGLYGCDASLRAYVAPTNAAMLAKAAGAGFLPGRMEGTKTRVPADFFIDEEGILTRCFYGKTISDHVPFEDVDDFLGSLM